MILLEARAKITLDNKLERSAGTGSYTDNQTDEKKKSSEINQVTLLTKKVADWNADNGKIIDPFRSVVVDALVDHGLNENSNPLYYLILHAPDAVLKNINYNKATKFESLVDSDDIKVKHVKKYLEDDVTFWSEPDNDVSYKLDMLKIFFNSRELSKYKDENGDTPELGDIMNGNEFMKADEMRVVGDKFFESDDDDDDDAVTDGVSLKDCLSELRLPNDASKLGALLTGKDFIANSRYGISDKTERQLLSDFVVAQLSSDSFSKSFLRNVVVESPVSKENCVEGIARYYEKVAKGKPNNYTFQTVAIKNGLNDKASQLNWFTSILAGVPNEADYVDKLTELFDSSKYTKFMQSGQLRSTAQKDVVPGLIKYLDSLQLLKTTGKRNIMKEKKLTSQAAITDDMYRERILQYATSGISNTTKQTNAINDITSGVFDTKLKKLYGKRHTVGTDNIWEVIDNELKVMLSPYL